MKRSTDKTIPVNTRNRDFYNVAAERDQCILGQRITLARNMKGISVRELQRQLTTRGVDASYSTLFRWERGETEPTAYQLLAICDVLDVPDMYSFFMSGAKEHQLNDEGLKKLYDYRDDLVASGKYTPTPRRKSNPVRMIEMPVSTLGASAGTGEFLSEENIELMRFPENSVPVNADFAIRVVGDSMEPVYQDHQLVWVQICNALTPGDVGIFVLDGEGYIKAYDEREPDEDVRDDFTDSNGVMHGQPMLISYNEKYAPKIVTTSSSFKICGKVLN